jgi:predicted CXXCH cytochrome family protein
MRKIPLPLLFITSCALFPCTAAFSAEANRVSPHSETGDCAVCHVAPAEKLHSWFAFGSTKKELKADPAQLCLNCHTVEPTHAGGFLGVGIGHAVGKKTRLNRRELPLAVDGTITCATTCHNVHASPDNLQLRPKLLRLPVNDLCLSCHNS